MVATIKKTPEQVLEELLQQYAIDEDRGKVARWYEGPGREALKDGHFKPPSLTDGYFSTAGLASLRYEIAQAIYNGDEYKLQEEDRPLSRLLGYFTYYAEFYPEGVIAPTNTVEEALDVAKYIKAGLKLRANIKALSWSAKTIVIMILHDDTPEIRSTLYSNGRHDDEQNFYRDLDAVYTIFGVNASREMVLASFERAGMDPWV